MFRRSTVALCFFAAQLIAAGANAGSTKTPTSDDVSPSEWRRLQIQAADKSDGIMRDAQKQPGLLGQYEFMQSHYDSNKERAFQLIFGQYLSWFQTYIGDYNGARRTFSIAQPVQPDDGPSPLNGGYQAKPAADVILALTKDRKAVFFNEAHSAPITRTLTIQLLSKLRQQGFNYFAAETLYGTDKDLNKRGYPTAKSGFYTSEPLYGEMVRTALKLGFKVVAYDVENAGVGDARERAGAESLYAQVFKHDPNARLVVNAGFAHIQKTGKYLGGSSMVEFFEKVAGFDPLCVEQTMLIQHARTDQDHPDYLAVTRAHRLSEPTAFVNADGKAWTLKPGQYDVSVFFPPQEGNDTRPDWLTLGGLRSSYPVASELCHNVFPCLVEARYANEGEDAIPADRVRMNVVSDDASVANRIVSHHGEATGELFLRPGSYHLSGTDKQGHVLSGHDISIGSGKEGAP